MSEPSTILKRLYETEAVQIWNRTTGPVFWYAAGVPGPFYVNTEKVIGTELAATLLSTINDTIASSNDPATRVTKLNLAILSAYRDNAAYQQVIAAMAEKARANFDLTENTLISGGERRDWLFSIPLAHHLGMRHLFLFKNGTSFCEKPLTAEDKAIHVADLINNAASYFDLWLPILKKVGLPMAGTVCVNSRGDNGVKKLTGSGYRVVAVNGVDLAFFADWRDQGLISAETYQELATYFKSPEEWGQTYLTNDPTIFGIKGLDKKSFDRLRSFFNQDPWQFRTKNTMFYNQMRELLR